MTCLTGLIEFDKVKQVFFLFKCFFGHCEFISTHRCESFCFQPCVFSTLRVSSESLWKLQGWSEMSWEKSANKNTTEKVILPRFASPKNSLGFAPMSLQAPLTRMTWTDMPFPAARPSGDGQMHRGRQWKREAWLERLCCR